MFLFYSCLYFIELLDTEKRDNQRASERASERERQRETERERESESSYITIYDTHLNEYFIYCMQLNTLYICYYTHRFKIEEFSF